MKSNKKKTENNSQSQEDNLFLSTHRMMKERVELSKYLKLLLTKSTTLVYQAQYLRKRNSIHQHFQFKDLFR